MSTDNNKPDNTIICETNDVILHMRQAIIEGKPWYIAMLEAIGLWRWPEEDYNGHHYCYLIDGEAFDWLLLAERLCYEITDFIPEEQLSNLLFKGILPAELHRAEFKTLIGKAKYHAYLNYFYGVVVEKFIIIAIEEEIKKERQAQVFSSGDDGLWNSYRRVYGASQEELLIQFQNEKGYPQDKSITTDRLREFTYWLFKYRLQNCDKARVASDTRKGLEYFKNSKINKDFNNLQVDAHDVIELNIL